MAYMDQYGVEFSDDKKTLISGSYDYKGGYVIPDGVSEIENSAFEECSGLTSVFIPDSVTSIGACAFVKCKNLTAINVSPDNPNYCSIDGVLYNKEIKTLIQYPGGKQGAYTIPDGVTGIEYMAFSHCAGLKSIDIPDSVTNIRYLAFEKCTGLIAINVSPDNPDYCSIDGVLFDKEKRKLIQYPCRKQGAYTIPDRVNIIESQAFEECTGLTSVFIPDSVTSIGFHAFMKCKNLTSIDVSKDNICYFSIDGVLFEGGIGSMRDEETILLKYPCRKQGAYTVPEGVTEIGGWAFEECSDLTSVFIPDSVTEIGSYAFSDCTGLTSVFIPDCVTEIGSYAFSDCTGLTSITLPHKITSIESGTFSGCSKLESIIIPDGVTSIGDSAFYDCSKLKSVTIPDTVTEIWDCAFSWCVNLNIDIPDSVTHIGQRAFDFTYPDLEW